MTVNNVKEEEDDDDRLYPVIVARPTATGERERAVREGSSVYFSQSSPENATGEE